jgi:hypothetical protein
MPLPDHPVTPHPKARFSIVLNRTHVLGKVEGVTVVAERIDITDQRVWLYARALSSTLTEQLTTEFWNASQHWRDTRQADGWIASGEPPQDPGEIMTHIEVTLAGNSPSANLDRHISVGRSGTEWHISWSWPRTDNQLLTFIGTSPEAENSELTVEVSRPN